MSKSRVASKSFYTLAKSLVDRETPKAIYPKVVCESFNWPREINSGMGKVKWICEIYDRKMGNPHAYHLNPLWQGMVRRQRLNGDWRSKTSNAYSFALKIQSGFYGNIRRHTDGWTCLQQLNACCRHTTYIHATYRLLSDINMTSNISIFSLIQPRISETPPQLVAAST